ncbi:hypothetical protein N7486_002162 [Penicillium sp. IBT 16267x]|nr:hypothetical protein N7486_002162 [Penicillium sp. IBT 16267x]
MSPLPVIACGGANPQIFNAVKPLYLPEYEIIHNVTSSTSGAVEIPLLLQGLAPGEDNRGTMNYSKPPVAIFAGALYGDEEIEEMRQACQGLSSVPWLKMDMTVPKPPLGPGYAEHVVQRIKECMKKIEAEGMLDQDGVIRDNFDLTTWLLFGATLQGLVVLVFPSAYAVLPPILMLSYLFSKTMLATLGLIKNPGMDGVIAGKFTTLLPDQNGVFSGKAADQNVAVILLAARSNHPMGMFGPGYKMVADFMKQMQSELANNATQYNYLGVTTWLGTGERSAANQLMFATYFRTLEDVHAYAQSPLHRQAWEWWHTITKSHPHLSIMHEVYQAPKSHWENIYINYHLTGIAAGIQSVFTPGDESNHVEKMWIHPIFDASKGKFKTHKGRLEVTEGDDNEEMFVNQTSRIY